MIEAFGRTPEGVSVERITLRAGAARARVLTWGATLQSLEVPDARGDLDDVVLGHDDLAGYLNHRSFFGSTVGRVANRIAGGRFTLDGREVRLARNEGETTLHGGPEGFDRRLWRIEAAEEGFVRLTLTSPDGDQGFPGELRVRVTCSLAQEGEVAVLTILHEAEAEAPTPVALTNHSFFALAGARGLESRPQSALTYRFKAAASRYLPVDAARIPSFPAFVEGTPFDFRDGTQPLTGLAGGYDHCLCLDQGRAELVDPVTGRRMELLTDQPGLQLYTGNFLDGSVRGKGGRAYARHDALCLEPQAWPDAVNMPPEWGAGSAILRPGERYAARIELRFSTEG